MQQSIRGMDFAISAPNPFGEPIFKASAPIRIKIPNRPALDVICPIREQSRRARYASKRAAPTELNLSMEYTGRRSGCKWPDMTSQRIKLNSVVLFFCFVFAGQLASWNRWVLIHNRIRDSGHSPESLRNERQCPEFCYTT